jgi:hypothetical protein
VHFDLVCLRSAGEGSTISASSRGCTTLLLWLVAATGCIEFSVSPSGDPSPPRPVVLVEESFVQAPLPSVDVLLVVDYTPSMSQELEVISAEVTALVEALDAASLAWQVGVVESDVTGDRAGELVGQPWVVTPATADREAVLSASLSPTLVRLGGEAGIEAALLALTQARSGANVGFRRPGAALHVVFLSDGDDRSELAGDAVTTFLDALDDEELHWGGPATASAVVGDVPEGCTSVRGVAQPGLRYERVATESGGMVASICSANLARVLSELGEAVVVLPARFPLTHRPTGTAVVTIDGASSGQWSLDLEDPAVVFDVPPNAGAVITVRYATSNTEASSSSAAVPSDPDVPAEAARVAP